MWLLDLGSEIQIGALKLAVLKCKAVAFRGLSWMVPLTEFVTAGLGIYLHYAELRILGGS